MSDALKVSVPSRLEEGGQCRGMTAKSVVSERKKWKIFGSKKMPMLIWWAHTSVDSQQERMLTRRDLSPGEGNDTEKQRHLMENRYRRIFFFSGLDDFV